MTLIALRRCRVILAGILIGLGMAPHLSLAADPEWPTRPVRFILPLGAGSGADAIARLFGSRLADKWGKPVTVENRPGADGILAITSFLNADDDHTLLLTATSAFTAHPYLHETLPYNVNRLMPVARMTDSLVALAVPANMPVNTVGDLVALAKSQPGKLNSASITGLLDLVFTNFVVANSLKVEKVPYRNPIDALNDLAVGRIHMLMTSYAILRPQAEAGRVKMLALTNNKPAAFAINMATAAQAGYPELTVDGLVGLFAVEKMSPAIRRKIASDIFAISEDPEVARRMALAGQVLNPGGPDEFRSSFTQQIEQAARIGKTLGIKPATLPAK